MTKDFEKYQSQTNITWTIVSVCVALTAERREEAMSWREEY